MVAIVGSQDLVVTHAQRGLAAIRAVGARIWHIGHFPGTRLITIGATGQRADRANINAHAAFFAGQVAGLVGDDDGVHAASADAQSLYIHAFIAYAHAAEAHDAARRIVIDQRRPFFFGVMQFFFGETAVVQTVAESHVLQFALAALVAHRAIEDRK